MLRTGEAVLAGSAGIEEPIKPQFQASGVCLLVASISGRCFRLFASVKSFRERELDEDGSVIEV